MIKFYVLFLFQQLQSGLSEWLRSGNAIGLSKGEIFWDELKVYGVFVLI